MEAHVLLEFVGKFARIGVTRAGLTDLDPTWEIQVGQVGIVATVDQETDEVYVRFPGIPVLFNFQLDEVSILELEELERDEVERELVSA